MTLADSGRRASHSLVILTALLAVAQCASGQVPVAVFNFQMKSETPDWLWLEKGLADRVTTDLFQSPDIILMDRDQMQRTAERMRWVPEMMQDPRQLQTIGFRARYVISGVYEVTGDTVKITAQVVAFHSSKEVARKTVSGPAEQSLELVRKLSAELLAWLTKREPEAALKELPVWTRNIPAARALYEGVDLYDQGRYAEAWLEFRRASREDPGYVEAQYWVGKMYYFMDRYEHARREYERFVYTNDAHPRMGDAILEFLHTYEKLMTPPEQLLKLYVDFEKRFSRRVFVAAPRKMIAGSWLRQKQIRLLADLGRFEEALELPAFWWDPKNPNVSEDTARLTVPLMADRHSCSGWLPDVDTFQRAMSFPGGLTAVCQFDEGDPIVRITPWGRKSDDGKWFQATVWETRHLLAPPGKVFKSLTITAELPAEARGEVRFGMSCYGNLGQWLTRTISFDDLRRGPVVLSGVPRRGWFYCGIGMTSSIEQVPLSIEAAFEGLGACGSLRVACDTASDFVCSVDGRLGRHGSGLVGPLAPGRHEVTFRPSDSLSPSRPWSTTAEVVAGKTTNLVGRLAWPEGSPLADWTTGVLLGRDYAILDTHFEESWWWDSPSIQVDDEAIRVVWSHHDDLWISESRDGATFSRPRRLALPISTGWVETRARLIRDETGRFVLMFASNRDMLHATQVYVCWSRDLVHWSSPAMIADNQTRTNTFAQDRRGRFLVVTSRFGKGRPWPVVASRDLARWEELGHVPPTKATTITHALVDRDDGRLELLRISLVRYDGKRPGTAGNAYIGVLERYLSSDGGRTWSDPEPLGEFALPTSGTGRQFKLAAVHSRGRTTAFLCRPQGTNVLGDGRGMVKVIHEAGFGQWKQSPWLTGLGNLLVDAAWHPRWGHLFAWIGDVAGDEKTGPFLIRGPSVEPLLAMPETDAYRQREAALWLRAVEMIDHGGPPDLATRWYQHMLTRFGETDVAPKARAAIIRLAEEQRLARQPKQPRKPFTVTTPQGTVTYAAFDGQDRVTYLIGGEATRFGTKAAKFAYGDNADYPEKATPYQWRTIWKEFWRVQPVDDKGAAAPGAVRRVEFRSIGGMPIFVVEQHMDYAAKPRPAISRVTIEHTFLSPDDPNRYLHRGPDECKEYGIEAEDVTDGDPALQGQWVTKVIPVAPVKAPGGAPEERERSRGEEAP